jgi:hypothetical protein
MFIMPHTLGQKKKLVLKKKEITKDYKIRSIGINTIKQQHN